MGAVILWCRAWLDRRKKPEALALADAKRKLEHLLIDEGMSRSQARRVVAQFYSAGGADAGLQ